MVVTARDAPPLVRARTLRRRAAVAALATLLAASLPAPAHAESGEAPLPRLWADFGVGFGNVDSSSLPYGDSSGGVLVDVTLGARLTQHWLLGFNLGGAGSQIRNSNYDSCNCYSNSSSVYGQAFTNVFLAVQYEPDVNRGWLFGAGAGRVLYHNRALEEQSGDYRSGDGNGGLVRVGYDWPMGAGSHLEAHLSFEGGRVTLSAPFGGSFSYRAVGLSVHISYH